VLAAINVRRFDGYARIAGDFLGAVAKDNQVQHLGLPRAQGLFEREGH
jgi:hypothetical protein